MVLELPEPDQTHLPGSPLELVVCQIQYDTRLAASDGVIARAIHDTLGHEEPGGGNLGYASVEEARSSTLTVAAGVGAPAAVGGSSLTGWSFTSQSGDWTVVVMPDNAILQTTTYTTWPDSFEPRLHRLIDALAEHVQPTFEQRLGLRYVDRITELGLTGLAEWEPYLRPELLGLARHPELGPGVRAAQHQTILQLDDEVQCGLRHGPLLDQDRGVVDYVLDYDLFRQTGRPFDPDEMKSAAARLNRWAHQIFQATVTEQLLEQFRESQ